MDDTTNLERQSRLSTSYILPKVKQTKQAARGKRAISAMTILYTAGINYHCSKFRKAYWEMNDDLCDQVRGMSPFNNTKILLDMIDTHTFDFLTGEYRSKRHTYVTNTF